MDIKVLEKANKIIDKVNQLKRAKEILSNYDATITCTISSHHNGNQKTFTSIEIPIELIKQDKPLEDVLTEEIHTLYIELEKL